MGGHVSSQVIRLSSNLILTRLLVPEMFGLMSLANILLIGLVLFSDLGIRQSIVQSPRGHEQAFLNTAWVVQIIRGAVIWLLALLLSLALYLIDLMHWWNPGSAYAEPLLPVIVAIISFNFLISGFESTKLATARRNMFLKRMTIIELAAQLGGIIFMLIWAWVNRSIWALVFGSFVTTIIRVALSHIALPGENNKYQWDVKAFHEIFHFGKWIFLTSILGFLAINGDRIILGNLIDAETLGVYSIAYFMFSAIQEILTKMMGNVAFPAFSEVVRNNPKELKQTYYKFRTPIDIVTLLALGLLFASGDLIIKFLYDDRYLPACHMLQILSVGLFVTRFALDKDLFMAIGKPKLMVPTYVINIFVLFVLVPLAFTQFGLNGALWVIGAGGFIALPLIFYLKIKYKILDLSRELVFVPLIFLGYGLGWVVHYLNNVLGLIS